MLNLFDSLVTQILGQHIAQKMIFSPKGVGQVFCKYLFQDLYYFLLFGINAIRYVVGCSYNFHHLYQQPFDLLTRVISPERMVSMKKYGSLDVVSELPISGKELLHFSKSANLFLKENNGGSNTSYQSLEACATGV